MKRLITIALIAACALPVVVMADIGTVTVIEPSFGDQWQLLSIETIEWEYTEAEDDPEYFLLKWYNLTESEYYIIDTVDGDVREYDWTVGYPMNHAIPLPIIANVVITAKLSGGTSSGIQALS
jgi:hypothetical protein